MSSTAQNPALTGGAAPESVQGHKSLRQGREKGRKVGGEDMELNMTSMIDVVFQLLIYFILTASFAVGEGVITAQLPQGTGAADSAKPPDQPLNIILTSAGTHGYRITVEGYHTAPGDFTQLQNILVEMQYDTSRGRNGMYKPDNPVIIKPDGTVRWQHVVNAFNATVAARYSNVAFAQAQR